MRGDAAVASSVVSMLVAGSIFVGVLAFAITGDWTGDVAIQAQPGDAHRAQALAGILLESPGHSAAGTDWHEDAADTLGRLGLAAAHGDRLDTAKLENLRRAPHDPDPADGLVSYEEARASLGLDGLDFHVRTVPALRAEGLLRHLRVTYVGDYERAPAAVPAHAGLGVGALSCARSPGDPHAWRLLAPLHNGGTVATQFHVRFAVDFDGTGAAVVAQSANGVLVPPGTAGTITLDLPATPGRACSAHTRVDVEVWDVATNLLSLPRQPLGHLGAAPAAAPLDLWLDTGGTHATPAQALRFDYGGGPVPGDLLTLTVHPGDDTAQPPLLQVEEAVPPGRDRSMGLPPGALPAGNYTLRLAVGAGMVPAAVATERLLVVPDPLPPYTPAGGNPAVVPQAAAAHEVAALAALAERFCPFRAGTTAESPLVPAPDPAQRCAFQAPGGPLGDIVPDTRRAIDRELPARLLDAAGRPRLDAVQVLVVGSDVDHQALAGGAARAAVRDWVLAGGHLVVLGTPRQDPAWLQPLLDAGVRSSSGGLAHPDETHPLLRTPHPLHAGTAARGTPWDLRDHEAQFTTVQEHDGRALLAVDNPGSHGAGNVLLAAWTPYDLGDGPGATPAETARVLANFLALAHRDLYLDYGPPLPAGAAVVPATTLATVAHPLLGDVTLTVLVSVFPR